MPSKILFQDPYALVQVAGRMESHGVDISIARPVRFELGRSAELAERVISSLLAGECEPEGMVQPRVLRRRSDCCPQHIFTFPVAAELPIQISEVDRCRRILGAEPQRSLVLVLC